MPRRTASLTSRSSATSTSRPSTGEERLQLLRVHQPQEEPGIPIAARHARPRLSGGGRGTGRGSAQGTGVEMEQLLGFALPGVPYGCTYALVAVCLVLTYQATGVFNFAFGAQAFASAFIFTYLTQYHNWSGLGGLPPERVVMGPVVGYVFDRLLFRHIPNSNSTAKLVCSLALLVGIPCLLPVIFGPQNLDATATIFPFFNPNVVYFTIGDADQRDLPGHHLGDRCRAHPADHPPALHESGSADARRRGEPTTGAARRHQRQRRGRFGLDRLELHGRPRRRAPGPGLRFVQLG